MKKTLYIMLLAGALGLGACSNSDDEDFLTVKYDGVEVTFKNINKWVAATEQAANDLEAKIAALEQQGVAPEVIEAVKAKIATLREALQTLLAKPSDEAFAAAMQAWQDVKTTFDKIFSETK